MPRSQAPLNTAAPAPRALLIAIQTPDTSDDEMATSLSELEQLVSGLSIVVQARVLQKRSDTLAVNVFGSGKLEEMRQLLETPAAAVGAHQETADRSLARGDDGPWLVVFDGELSPGQQRSLAAALEVEVVDRTQVILTVFEQRARTRVAQLEIELARLRYEAPRIRDQESMLARQAGGGGRGGRGHTTLQLKKQEIRRRMSALQKELEGAQQSQQKRRERRAEVQRVALVGYTNAGKSSWMRSLTGDEILVEDALFATLDTTLRVLKPVTSPRVVVADTVGFLRRLPNHLLASFRSTLDEALDADLLVFVVDAADAEWPQQLSVTRQVLADVGASGIPSLVLLNKCDRLGPDERAELSELLPDALQVSAQTQADVKRVRSAILAGLQAQQELAVLRIPYSDGALLSSIHAGAHVLSEKFDESCVQLQVRAKPEFLAACKKRLHRPAARA